MFYRAFALGIIAFWLLMMALLVRVEYAVDEASLLPVPADYVWNLIFLHEQPSDLVLYHQRQRIGSIHLQPSHLPNATGDVTTPVRVLSGSASLAASLPGLNSQNITVRGALEMDAHDTAQRFGFNASIHTARRTTPGVTIVLDGEPARQQWHYQLRQGEKVLQEASGTPAVLLDALDLRSLGFDPTVAMQAVQQQMAAATVKARRGALHTDGEDIECYLVTARQAESLEATIYVSQLGQILAVKTFTGYDLYDENITP